MKGQDVCYKHEAQEKMEQRRAAMRQALALPPLVDLKSVQRGIQAVAQSLIENRIDAKVAGETLHSLQRASAGLRLPRGLHLPRLPQRRADRQSRTPFAGKGLPR